MSEQDLQNFISQCVSKLANSQSDLSLISSDVFKAENLLRQLKIEATCLPIYEKQEIMTKCVKYNGQLSQIKKQIRDKEQERLFGEKLEVKLNSSAALLDKQGENLELSKMVSLESEQIASNTMTVLKSQRHQLQKSSTNAKEIQENLSKSSRMITSIQRRSLTNKLIMLCIIFLLILSILLISFIKLTT